MGSKPAWTTNQNPVSKNKYTGSWEESSSGEPCGFSHPRLLLSNQEPPPLPHRDDSAEVDVYNPTKDEWDKIPSMNQVSLQVWQRL